MIKWDEISLEDLAALLSKEFKKRGIEAVLVGGACVTIYSKNRYQSYDLDFVVYEDMKKVRKVLKELHFNEVSGYFKHENCKWFIEFVSSPVAVGKEIISRFQNFTVRTGTIKMLRIEDSIKDRLASYFHWNDRQGLNQALEICKEQRLSTKSMKEIESWASLEGFQEKFGEFAKHLKQVKNKM